MFYFILKSNISTIRFENKPSHTHVINESSYETDFYDVQMNQTGSEKKPNVLT